MACTYDFAKKKLSIALVLIAGLFNVFAAANIALLIFVKIQGKQHVDPLFWLFAGVTLLNVVYWLLPREGFTSLRGLYLLSKLVRLGTIFCNAAILVVVFLLVPTDLSGRVVLSIPYFASLSFATLTLLSYSDAYGVELARQALFRTPKGMPVNRDELPARTKASITRARADLYAEYGSKIKVIPVITIVFCLLTIVLDKKSVTPTWILPALLVSFFGVGIGFLLQGKAGKLYRRSALELFGASESEIMDLGVDEARSEFQNMKLHSFFQHYRSIHEAEVSALEKDFMKWMTEQFGFNPDFAEKAHSLMFGQFRLSNAIFWHREHVKPEDVARKLYKSYSTPSGLQNPLIFRVDQDIMKTKNPPERVDS